jgi:dTDP-4-dehydrorhamnose reductase
MGNSKLTGATLVLGASSNIGQRLVSRLGRENVIATFNRTPVQNGLHFDARVMALSDLPIEPDQISNAVILLGDTILDSVASDQIRARALNVTALSKIIDQLNSWDIKPIFTSTEVVYDGTGTLYDEESPANPIVLYGQQKLEIERYIQANFSDYVIFRLARIYGDTPGDGTIFIDWAQKILQGEKIICANNQRFSPVYIEDVIDCLIAAIHGRLSGLYVLGGPVGLSRLECLEMLIEAFGSKLKHPVDLEICSILDFPAIEPRPLDTTVSSKLLETEIGIRFTEIKDVCERIVTQISNAADGEKQS